MATPSGGSAKIARCCSVPHQSLFSVLLCPWISNLVCTALVELICNTGLKKMSINQESAIQQPLKNQLEDFYQISQNMFMGFFWLDVTQHTPHNSTAKNNILWCPPSLFSPSLPINEALSSRNSLPLSRKSVLLRKVWS